MPFSYNWEKIAILEFTKRVNVIPLEIRVSVVFKCSTNFIFVNNNLENFVLKVINFLSRQFLFLGKDFRLAELCLNHPYILGPCHLIPFEFITQLKACKSQEMLTTEVRISSWTFEQIIVFINLFL